MVRGPVVHFKRSRVERKKSLAPPRQRWASPLTLVFSVYQCSPTSLSLSLSVIFHLSVSCSVGTSHAVISDFPSHDQVLINPLHRSLYGFYSLSLRFPCSWFLSSCIIRHHSFPATSVFPSLSSLFFHTNSLPCCFFFLSPFPLLASSSSSSLFCILLSHLLSLHVSLFQL